MKRQPIFTGMLVLTLTVQASAQDKPAPTQEQAVAAIEKLGGKVDVDDTSPKKPVIRVIFKGGKVTDAGLVHLRGLSELKTLYLDGSSITDAGLVNLKGLTKLETLGLSQTAVTRTGLVHLKGMVKLQTLGLSRTSVTDSGLVHLKGLTTRWASPTPMSPTPG